MDDARASARLRLALDLHETGVEMMRQRLRREHPEATDAELRELLGAWLRDRPGARRGDAVGPSGRWPRST